MAANTLFFDALRMQKLLSRFKVITVYSLLMISQYYTENNMFIFFAQVSPLFFVTHTCISFSAVPTNMPLVFLGWKGGWGGGALVLNGCCFIVRSHSTNRPVVASFSASIQSVCCLNYPMCSLFICVSIATRDSCGRGNI